MLEPDSLVDGAGISLYGTVLNDGGRLRMWYQAWPRNWRGGNADYVGYAESDDGIEWKKPRLGLVDFEGTDNNLVDLKGHPPAFFIDPDAPADHRYRGTICTGPFHEGAQAHLTRYGFYTAHSADGLHWQYDRDEPRWKSADMINCAYNPTRRKAVIAMKYMHRFQGFTRRSIWEAGFENGQWTDQHMALIPDDYDNVRAMSQGYAGADYYGMGLMPAGQGMVGFLWQFRHSNLPRPMAGPRVLRFGGCYARVSEQVGRLLDARPGEAGLHQPCRDSLGRGLRLHSLLPGRSGRRAASLLFGKQTFARLVLQPW